MIWKLCQICLFFILTTALLPSEALEQFNSKRAGRIFLVSTTSSTTVVTTSTLCWASTNAAITTQCSKKKKRREIQPADQEIVAPSRMEMKEEEGLEAEDEDE